MKDAGGRIIYVGKAANLRKRVASYFRPPEQLPRKTMVMMHRVATIDSLCTGTEKEALLLESSLIKKHRPRYNVILRDDKSYVLFKLDKGSAYPRLRLTRSVQRDGSLYFGPYTSAQSARETLRAVNRIFPLRKCSDSVFNNRTRPCLQYHLSRCLGPCCHQVPRGDYEAIVQQVELFLRGRSKELLQRLEEEMQEASRRLAFEKAAEIRDQMEAVRKTVEQQTVVLPHGGNMDVIGLGETEGGSALGVLFVREGKLLDRRTFFFPEEGGEGAEQAVQPRREAASREETGGAAQRAVEEVRDEMAEIVRSFLIQFYRPEGFIPELIVLPVHLQDYLVEEILSERRGESVRIRAARGSREKRLLDLARTNALQSQQESPPSALSRLASKLRLDNKPDRIEAVDASHLHGTGMVVGQVVFEGEHPRKDAYRLYAFPELEGSMDDYAALRGWVRKRIRSGPPWPDLVLLDGGKGQLAAVEQALRDAAQEAAASGEESPDLTVSWRLLALAKGERRGGELHEHVFRPGRKNPLPLKPGSAELLFLQHVRDNVHRYVLSRQKRSRRRSMLDSSLERLPGVGPKTAALLWRHFGSLESMQRAGEEELAVLPGIGPRKARRIREALQGLDAAQPGVDKEP